ncbi:ParB/RepB/Spo0J family partition protein [Taibaiella chishuiensis]|uniref:ParB family chromosome partitioning protein n=1 Tax=Taibaiella chishuiensis TaxID=1434707 RepID=A0A2P8CWN2_9BACT|nr:ParB/RepB/Spo0J family partition protein [Taibaiella chishuiensis]PSK89349.1 ParB family chromosome partitioning protein [Taibaiella chishuiensis]
MVQATNTDEKVKENANMTNSNNKKKALGLGIKALLNNIDEELKATSEAVPAAAKPASATVAVGGRIPVDQIEVNPKQPRHDFDEQALKELSESIALHDIIQPITVAKMANGKYRLISGERRFRASKMAGLKDIPAYIRTVDDQELLELALLENLQRENLNAMEIALSYKRLMDECTLTQEQVAERMKKERSTVTNYLRLLKLPPDIQKSVRDGQLSMGHARAIISLENVDEQLYVHREVIQKGLSVRQVEQLVKNMIQEKKPLDKNAPVIPKLPPAYKRIEDNMASHFATRVSLSRKKNGKGSIQIEFYSDEDLERIMDAMKI